MLRTNVKSHTAPTQLLRNQEGNPMPQFSYAKRRPERTEGHLSPFLLSHWGPMRGTPYSATVPYCHSHLVSWFGSCTEKRSAQSWAKEAGLQ